MKAKLSLLIPLLTIVGLVACTAPTPAPSTTTVAPSTTTVAPTSTTTTTSIPVYLDANFINSEVLYRAEVFSPVFDAGNFSKLSLLLQCTNNFSWVKLQVSSDGINWYDQKYYFGETCRVGLIETVITLSRYYRALAYGIDGRTENITMFGRFYN